jgi:DNA/RNA-binding domain of Phe-tRNA-synthetase-like protein
VFGPMNALDLTIQAAQHPLLRPVAFTTAFPQPLGEIPSPKWLLELLHLEAPAPLERHETLRLAVRDMLRHWGHRPAGRGKPASEYLVRAVGEGELGPINVAVDVCNVVSLHSGLPIALLDVERATPPLRVGRGAQREHYVFNPAGQEMELEGLICLYDAQGPCANPVKDAQRVKTHRGTIRTLTVIWGVAGHEPRRDAAYSWYQELLERLGGVVNAVQVRGGTESPIPGPS